MVHLIMESPTSPTRGVGSMKGQMLVPVIKVPTVRRGPEEVEKPAAPAG